MSDEEEEYRPKLKPVYPSNAEAFLVTHPRFFPHKSSRKLKFLGLVEPEPHQGLRDVYELFTHGRDFYDAAYGPQGPKTRRPNQAEWSEPFMGEPETEALEIVAKQRKSEIVAKERKKNKPKRKYTKRTNTN